MSVINDMLRDLDERNARDAQVIAATNGAVIAPVQKTSGNNINWLWVLVLFLLLIAGTFATLLVRQNFVVISAGHESELAAAPAEFFAREPDTLLVELPTKIINWRSQGSEELKTDAIRSRLPSVDFEQVPLNLMNEALPLVMAQDTEAATAHIDIDSVTHLPTPSLDKVFVDQVSATTSALIEGNATFSKSNLPPSLNELDRAASEEALRLVRVGRNSTAIKNLQDFMFDHPAAMKARETLAVLQFSNGLIEVASNLVEEGLNRDQSSLPMLKLKARILVAQGQTSSALELLRNNLSQINNDEEFLSLHAGLSQQNSEHEEALDLYRQLLERNRSSAQWWIGQAVSLEQLGRRQDALNSYRSARRIPNIDARLKRYTEARIAALH